jgi:fibronectin-binding autotransporter adhesin
MINAFGNYIGFGNQENFPEFFVTGSGVDILTFGDEQVYVFYNTSGSIGQGTGSFSFGNNYECEFLVVAGGGQGGYEMGGGGGGGVLSGSFVAQKGIKYDVSVGPGGQYRNIPSASYGNPGINSFITSSASIPFSILAFGGGGGYNGNDGQQSPQQLQGGSGGGGGAIEGNFPFTITVGGSGSLGQGKAGGTGSMGQGNFPEGEGGQLDYLIGGGGGGAATAGVNGSTFQEGANPLHIRPLPGNGGNGIFGTITQTGSYYGGGGGADYEETPTNYKFASYAQNPTGSGGLGGANAYSSSLDRSGGGGGASGRDYRSVSPPSPGGPTKFGNGGSGIVVVRFNTKEPIV